jgi:hypothetical protein
MISVSAQELIGLGAHCYLWIKFEILTRVALCIEYLWWKFDQARVWLQPTFAVMPRPGDAYVSPSWITQVLEDACLLTDPNNAVVSVECATLDGNRGLVGSMARLNLTYRNAPTAELPRSLILKCNRGGYLGIRNSLAMGQYREALVYANMKRIFQLPKAFKTAQPLAFQPPRVYFTHVRLGSYIILMEDLKAPTNPNEININMNMFFGNQTWGVPKPITENIPPWMQGKEGQLSLLRSIFIRSAHLHAIHWQSPLVTVNRRAGRLGMAYCLKRPEWYAGQGRLEWEQGMFYARHAWQRLKAKTPIISSQSPPPTKAKALLRLSKRFCAIMDQSFEKTTWLATLSLLQSRPWTLTHGDFHAANMILRVDPKRFDSNSSKNLIDLADMILFDWSELRPWTPAADLAQMVISDCRSELFPYTRKLLEEYHALLVKYTNGSALMYTMDQCWDDFIHSGVERWLWLFAILSTMPGLPSVVMQYFHDQIIHFIEIHGATSEYVISPVTSIL